MTDKVPSLTPRAVIIGGGPAGLMAAEVLSKNGVTVDLYEKMPSVGRKFLMAGRGGLNLTHSEDFEAFISRYGDAAQRLRPYLENFTPASLMAWAEGLGQPLFVGSSGRVFPKAMKASSLLRAWLTRLSEGKVNFHLRHDWQGWDSSGALAFQTPDGSKHVKPEVTILALGGASWPRLGSDGGWSGILQKQGIPITPLRPANCGFTIRWSEIFQSRFAGVPLKNIALTFEKVTVRGEVLLTRYGVEGGGIYALSASLRDAVIRDGSARLAADLRPDQSVAQLTKKLGRPRGGQTVANFLRKALNLSPLEINLLREAHGADFFSDTTSLASKIKAVPLTLIAPQPLTRAISTAGGVTLSALDENLMLRDRPGIFVAGEMLDWEAPTGGYLLQACFATGLVAAQGALRLLKLIP